MIPLIKDFEVIPKRIMRGRVPKERAVIFVTDLFIMEETCVLPGRNLIVINAVWKISARKISDTEGEKEYGIEGSTSYCVACI